MANNPNIFYRDKKCIKCHRKFKTPQVKSNAVRIDKRDTDNCPYYKLDNPLLYEFYICPHCHMVFTDHFEEITKQKDKDILDRLFFKMRNVENLFEERNIDDGLRLAKLALVAGESLKETSIKLAPICLRIAWFNRYKEDVGEESRFLSNAYAHFEKAYNNSDLKIKDKSVPEDFVVYTLAELSYRIGVYINTKSWFNQLFKFPNRSRYVMKGRDRWSDIRQEITKVSK
ncbi:DUF2225 domain-containing protein [Anaeromicrobium sediminis]|uniref:DUF2225 domain-containing protein n=1 Tax=Anaeromicrobium sediminis TaxID=1478221 RepID=A0A267MEE0_9FIRM|nr:DUF2225 domain-containing protein [Anaeromicrobium sediminis]PAB57245.1 hypothetical protein CCE28_19365 [Anaeromicrobium sediminis]